MSQFVEDFESQINDIQPVPVSAEILKEYSSEDHFNELIVKLLIETGSYVCVASCLLPASTRRWNRDQAIVGGNIVRLYKLISALLDQTCQKRRETSFILGRLAFETIVNLAFLIKNASPELFDSYVRYSLQHEKKLLNQVNQNTSDRGGEVLEIERRMLNSIQRTFEKSGISANEATTNGIRNWGNKNIYDRAKDVGLDQAYLAAFGGGSHSVHGNWMDLLEYHLEDDEEGFSPQLKWRYPRPQLLSVIAIFATEVTGKYIEYINEPVVSQLLHPRLIDLRSRIQLADSIHEQFLRG